MNENQFTEEQKKRAARLEREIEEGKGKVKRKQYNEDVDEEMDVTAQDAKMDQDYDDYIANNEVLKVDELEKRQLSNSSQIATGESKYLKQYMIKWLFIKHFV